MMVTLPHVTSGLGLRKFQTDGFLLDRVYKLSSTTSNSNSHVNILFDDLFNMTIFKGNISRKITDYIHQDQCVCSVVIFAIVGLYLQRYILSSTNEHPDHHKMV